MVVVTVGGVGVVFRWFGIFVVFDEGALFDGSVRPSVSRENYTKLCKLFTFSCS